MVNIGATDPLPCSLKRAGLFLRQGLHGLIFFEEIGSAIRRLPYGFLVEPSGLPMLGVAFKFERCGPPSGMNPYQVLQSHLPLLSGSHGRIEPSRRLRDAQRSYGSRDKRRLLPRRFCIPLEVS